MIDWKKQVNLFRIHDNWRHQKRVPRECPDFPRPQNDWMPVKITIVVLAIATLVIWILS